MKKIYFLIVIGFGFATLYAQDNCATALPITTAGTFTITFPAAEATAAILRIA